MERLTGLDVRTIREHIRQLIVDYGIPVCGGRDNKLGGYYIPPERNGATCRSATTPKAIRPRTQAYSCATDRRLARLEEV
ncbi:TPA: hypothetical protein ACHU8D_001138 [Streptococcus suis]|nr:hypothetical protein [Streptococcus suis]